MRSKAILIGNSDGIGLSTTMSLLSAGWNIIGISRSSAPISDPAYQHRVADVSEPGFSELIDELVLEDSFDLCIYFVGIGERLNTADMNEEAKVIDVNLTGMIKTAAGVIPGMVQRKNGHFIGISSLADELLSAEAPSYHASKAGFSNYLRGLALAVKANNVYVTNVRFGFVDTKMAKNNFKPFMMSAEKAAKHLVFCIRKKPICYTAPKMMVPLIKLRKVMMALGAK